MDQTALYRALVEGEIAGAALDVMEQELPQPMIRSSNWTMY